jgi:vancomycin aglycone glucosyltransferase
VRAPASSGKGSIEYIGVDENVGPLFIAMACRRPSPAPSAALRTALTPETRARATAVAGAIRTDGATVAATLLIDVSRERLPVYA